jgi:hypothetical protein
MRKRMVLGLSDRAVGRGVGISEEEEKSNVAEALKAPKPYAAHRFSRCQSIQVGSRCSPGSPVLNGKRYALAIPKLILDRVRVSTGYLVHEKGVVGCESEEGECDAERLCWLALDLADTPAVHWLLSFHGSTSKSALFVLNLRRRRIRRPAKSSGTTCPLCPTSEAGKSC